MPTSSRASQPPSLLRYSLPRFLHSDTSQRAPEHREAIVETPCQRGGGGGVLERGSGVPVSVNSAVFEGDGFAWTSASASRTGSALARAHTHANTCAYTYMHVRTSASVSKTEKNKPSPSSWNTVLHNKVFLSRARAVHL